MAPTAPRILFVQLLAWLSIPLLLWATTWPLWLAAFGMYFMYGGVGVALTFHRILSHGAFRVSPLVRRALIIIGSFANVGSPLLGLPCIARITASLTPLEIHILRCSCPGGT